VADDVAQETFLRLWKEARVVEGDARTIIAWLYRTSTRLAIDVLRDRQRKGGEDDPVEALPCAVDLAACAEAKAAIRLLARHATGDELSAAVLCRVDGLAQPEAANVLGVSERTVRRMLDRFDRRIDALRREFS
jgi:RNA polymerase sigma-70 factor (ECF subfamily)